jgi:hypothetical protein
VSVVALIRGLENEDWENRMKRSGKEREPAANKRP